MEAANGTHITAVNNVIVQCSDPSGIFDKVQPLLEARLPLRTLHWKSATRPLRSIDELDVSLVREDKSVPGAARHPRRHQIPGLRQTPFIKLLLLRCDDKESYKETVRRDAKAWVKSLGVSPSGKPTAKGQERHDAYEYIIVHVVFPDTPAALQPKSSKHISVGDSESTDSVNSTNKSKWTGKSSSTIFDKLRADFHSSSKAPFERVAQIRLTDPQKPSTALGPLEVEEQWNDLIDKLKVAILQSFDARVAQYEEDIREREAQRTLPGWNFCTFFILKEGLARGFENVGLLEDALSVYEELDAGLDGIIQAQAKDGDADAMNALLPYAADLKPTIRRVLENKADDQRPLAGSSTTPMMQHWIDLEKNHFPLSLDQRDYQQMILTNQVSALDFRIYIFIRQTHILLRRAVIPESTKSGKRQYETRYDATVLAKVCERSLRFTNLAARNLRQDLYAAWGGSEALPEHEQHNQQIVIDNIVSSWKWAAFLQTLYQCQIVKTILNSFALSDDSKSLHEDSLSPQVLTRATDLGRDRAMSINSTSTDASTPMNDTNTIANSAIAAAKNIRGQREGWIFWAAEILYAMRSILMKLTSTRDVASLNQIDGRTSSSSSDESNESEESVATGLLAASLRYVAQSDANTGKAFRLLSAYACQCYSIAGKKRTAHALLLDLARDEFRFERYASAAGWLDAIDGFLDREPSNHLDYESLDLYAQCLMHLDRPTERVRCLILCIRSVSKERKDTETQNIFQNALQAAVCLDKVEETSAGVFELVRLENHIDHIGLRPAVSLKLLVRIFLPISVPELHASLFVKAKGFSEPSHVEFTYSGIPVVEDSTFTIEVHSNILTFGWYELDRLQIRIGKLHFLHEFKTPYFVEDEEGFKTPGSHEFVPRDIYIYPPLACPIVQAFQAHHIDLSVRRSVVVNVDWQLQNLESALLRLKPSTAGFRLDLQSAKHLHPTGPTPFVTRRINDVLVLEFSNISGMATTTLEIPYTLDTSAPVMSASISSQLTYIIGGVEYQLYQPLSISTVLPISVNVQDIFQAEATFCRFTIAPSGRGPVLLIGCHLDENDRYEVIAPTNFKSTGAVDVFQTHPAGWIAKVTRKSNTLATASLASDSKLQLHVQYTGLDEMASETILHCFEDDLKASDLTFALRPLRAHLLEQLMTLWSELDIELVAVTHEIHLWPFEAFRWSLILFAFERPKRNSIVTWLQEWHAKRAIIELQTEAAPVRSLKLMVDVSRSQIIVTTQLKLEGSSTIVVGVPLRAHAFLTCTEDVSSASDLEVSFEILAPAESWLIGGKRKAGFLASQRQHRADLVLVPQRTGHLLLPSLDVRCRHTNTSNVVSIDTEHLSAATSVFVTPGLEFTAIGLANSELDNNIAGQGRIGDSSNWLIDSRRRTEEID